MIMAVILIPVADWKNLSAKSVLLLGHASTTHLSKSKRPIFSLYFDTYN